MCLILSATHLVYGMTTCPTVDLLPEEMVGWLLPWLLLLFVWLLLSLVCVDELWLLSKLFWFVELLLLRSSQLLFNTLFCILLIAQLGVIALSQGPTQMF